MDKTKKVYKCPKCGSKNLICFMGFQTGMKYQCLDCSYIGPLKIEEIETK